MNALTIQPTLNGKLLFLRPLIQEDFEALFAVSSDPLIWEQHPAKNRYQRSVFLSFFSAAIESKGALIAIDSSTNEVIGSSRFTGVNLPNKSVEVGYTFLARKYWGKGFNAEMKNLMLGHAFQAFDRVLFYIGENNFSRR